ncbi:MAG: hypothetical protein AAGD92_12535 [Pseudomonadota bacterium]
MSNIFLIELLIVYGLILAWAFWEFRKTSALHKKTEAEERKKSGEDAAPTNEN